MHNYQCHTCAMNGDIVHIHRFDTSSSSQVHFLFVSSGVLWRANKAASSSDGSGLITMETELEVIHDESRPRSLSV